MHAPVTPTAPLPSSGADASAAEGERASWFSTFEDGDPAAYRYLLMMRFAIVNTVAFALLLAAFLQGWVDAVLTSDATHLVLLISAVFGAGLLLCAQRIILTSAELNHIREPARHAGSKAAFYLESIHNKDGQSRAISASSLKLKLAARIATVRHVANSLVFLGLIGTVIGFMIALSGVDPQSAADVGSIGPMVSTLISGMSVALSTTLVGSILNIWLMVNYRILESGTLRLLTAIIELGERHARS